MRIKNFLKINIDKINLNKMRSFTLVELLVAMTIFFICTGLAISILSTTLKGQRSALATQQIIDQTSYALEYISRSVRMAQVGTLQITRSGSGVSFVNSKGEQQEIFVSDGKINQLSDGETINLTSDDVQVMSSSFIRSDTLQPQITVAMAIKTTGTRAEEITEIKLQTTISQRNLE
jgi:Tfp pilus assembly protein FimT